jgi:hypothetical protein
VSRLDFDRLTLSQRKVAAGGLAFVWAVFVILMFGPCDRAGPPDVRENPGSPAVTFDSPPAPTTEPQAIVEGEPGDSAVVSDRALQRARRVASDFVEAYATYSFEDDRADFVDRIEPHVTPSFAAEFELSSGAGAFHNELASRRERAVVEVETAQTQAVTSNMVELLVVARRIIRSTDGRAVERPTYLVRVSQTSDGWKVTALTL